MTKVINLKLYIYLLIIIFLSIMGCGGHGDPPMRYSYVSISFVNKLNKKIEITLYHYKNYKDPKMGQEEYGTAVTMNSEERALIMEWDYPTKIVIVEEATKKVLSETEFGGTGDDIKNYPNNKELKVIEYIDEEVIVENNKRREIKITLTQNLENEVWK